MTKRDPGQLLTTRERLHDAAWTVGTSVASTLLAAFGLYTVGELTGVNDRIFDGTCESFDSLSSQEKNTVLTDPAARRRLDRDRDGSLCES
ncbi:hypothetical protein Q9S36_48060 [Microbacterium sp. ARD31]|uniref:hypothetical protein n=1 Tax=Microbacterium sp. ARD31 TaxID=2962576 RepID=UPI00288192CE|nr:hypothetical protein [Microbacterium sp. ARD31]MDT0187969.1 hypothetical protein [Microbacterium sp. ARD31]